MKKINLVIPIHMPDFVYNGLRSIKRRYRTPSTDADAQKPPDSAINIDQLNAIPVTDKWANPLSTLRGKWGEVPTLRSSRRQTSDLNQLSDDELLQEWQSAKLDITTGEQFDHRGWYHSLYAESFAGKNLLDVGSGFAIDSVTLAQHGARVTFLDIVKENLEVVKRICSILGVRDAKFFYMPDLSSLESMNDEYDAILALGSLHHAPFAFVKNEVDLLMRHLKIGGRWLQLAYPKTRWQRDGQPPFDQWGAITDGEKTPWAEWYDLPKLLALLSPAKFEVVLCREFQNQNFIWFDLLRIS